MKRSRVNLCTDTCDENGKKDERANRIAQIERHGKRVTACFAQCGGKNLDDPERQRDFRNFTYIQFGQ